MDHILSIGRQIQRIDEKQPNYHTGSSFDWHIYVRLKPILIPCAFNMTILQYSQLWIQDFGPGARRFFCHGPFGAPQDLLLIYATLLIERTPLQFVRIHGKLYVK